MSSYLISCTKTLLILFRDKQEELLKLACLMKFGLSGLQPREKLGMDRQFTFARGAINHIAHFLQAVSSLNLRMKPAQRQLP